jgi:hypothetical protein
MSDEYCAYGRQEECIQSVPRNGKRKDDMRDLDINVRIILQSIARTRYPLDKICIFNPPKKVSSSTLSSLDKGQSQIWWRRSVIVRPTSLN